jgi:hypothetical protein
MDIETYNAVVESLRSLMAGDHPEAGYSGRESLCCFTLPGVSGLRLRARGWDRLRVAWNVLLGSDVLVHATNVAVGVRRKVETSRATSI